MLAAIETSDVGLWRLRLLQSLNTSGVLKLTYLQEMEQAASRSSLSIIVAVLQIRPFVLHLDPICPHVVGRTGDFAIQQ